MKREEMKSLAADCRQREAPVPMRVVRRRRDGKEIVEAGGVLYVRDYRPPRPVRGKPDYTEPSPTAPLRKYSGEDAP